MLAGPLNLPRQLRPCQYALEEHIACGQQWLRTPTSLIAASSAKCFSRTMSPHDCESCCVSSACLTWASHSEGFCEDAVREFRLCRLFPGSLLRTFPPSGGASGGEARELCANGRLPRGSDRALIFLRSRASLLSWFALSQAHCTTIFSVKNSKPVEDGAYSGVPP